MKKFEAIFVYILVNMVIATNYGLYLIYVISHGINIIRLLGDITFWHFIISANPLFAYCIYDILREGKKGD